MILKDNITFPTEIDSRMQGRVQYSKGQSIWYLKLIEEKKNHMICSIDSDKPFVKIQHPFEIKGKYLLSKLHRKGNM